MTLIGGDAPAGVDARRLRAVAGHLVMVTALAPFNALAPGAGPVVLAR